MAEAKLLEAAMATVYHLLPQGEPPAPIPAGTELYARYEDATHVATEIWLPPTVYEVEVESHALGAAREEWVTDRNLRLVTTLTEIPAPQLTRRKWFGLVHGIANGYAAHKCRCLRCTEAHSTAVKAAKKATAARGSFLHGLNGYLSYGCRCEVCKEAYRTEPSPLEPLAKWWEDEDPYRRLVESEDPALMMDWAYLFRPYRPYEKRPGLVYATREPECTFSIGDETIVGHARVPEKVEWPEGEPFSTMAFLTQEEVRKAVATGCLPGAAVLPKVSDEAAAAIMASYGSTREYAPPTSLPVPAGMAKWAKKREPMPQDFSGALLPITF